MPATLYDDDLTNRLELACPSTTPLGKLCQEAKDEIIRLREELIKLCIELNQWRDANSEEVRGANLYSQEYRGTSDADSPSQGEDPLGR